MCQPGRPGPQGLSQAGSPGFAAFQSAKSAGSCFSSPSSMRDSVSESTDLPESLPYAGSLRTEKYTSPLSTG